jgi:hypothetical protein
VGGLLVLFLIGLYVTGANKLVRRTQPIWAKALIVIAALLIPTADAIYGSKNFKEMCKADAGLRIHRSVENVEGFSTGNSSPYESWVTKFGYSYVEGYRFGEQNKETMRYVSDRDGKAHLIFEKNGVLKSRYLLTDTKDDSRMYLRRQDVIKDLVTNEILATNTTLIYFGGWVERGINGLYASRGTNDYCPKTEGYKALVDLVTQTLQPVSPFQRSSK